MNPISTISRAFNDTKARQEAVLIVYLTAGYPTLERSIDLVKDCARSGADIIEIGIPFSDPVADGPSIQESSQEALNNGVTLDGIMNVLTQSTLDVPCVIMSYLNPILAFGVKQFLKAMHRAHASGLILPDLPFEEAGEWVALTRQENLDLILLAAPTSSTERLACIAARSQGFIYCISTTGTTGVRQSLPEELTGFVHRIRTITDKPCAVGFGISKPEHIMILRDDVDGVIVGSRIIEGIRRKENIKELVGGLKKATRR